MSEGMLNLRVMDAPDQYASYDVIAQVQPIGPENSEAPARDLVVSAAETGGTEMALDAGFYSVRLFLPSGRVLQQNCHIIEGDRSSLVFQAPMDVESGFSLQASIGDASLAALLESAVRARPLTSRTRSDEPASAGTKRQVKPNAGRIHGRNLRATPAGRTGEVLHFSSTRSAGPARAGSVQRSARTLGASIPGKTATLALSETGAFTGSKSWADLAGAPQRWFSDGEWAQIPASQARDDASIWRIEPPQSPDGGRTWAVVQTHKAVELISLPTPWYCVQGGAISALDILVDATVGGRAASSIAIHDAAMDGLLSYLDRGRMTALRPMMDELDRRGLITAAIHDKMLNPLAACAAAYVGLALFDGDAKEQWDGWLANIMRRFAWLPDGGILHARRIMLRPKGPGERAQVIPALKKAVQAGVPYYSAGLQMLREMLEVLREEEPEAAGLLATIQPVLARSDPRQLFTILRYPRVSA